MLSVIGICGQPGSGKTHCIKSYMMDSGAVWEQGSFGLLRYHRDPRRQITIFGVYDDTSKFDGTDRLSMAVQPDAELYINSKINTDEKVIFEGDRLFNCKFLCVIDSIGAQSTLFHINTNDEKANLQRAKRGTNQPSSFISSRITKIKNISKKHSLQSYSQASILRFLLSI